MEDLYVENNEFFQEPILDEPESYDYLADIQYNKYSYEEEEEEENIFDLPYDIDKPEELEDDNETLEEYFARSKTYQRVIENPEQFGKVTKEYDLNILGKTFRDNLTEVINNNNTTEIKYQNQTLTLSRFLKTICIKEPYRSRAIYKVYHPYQEWLNSGVQEAAIYKQLDKKFNFPTHKALNNNEKYELEMLLLSNPKCENVYRIGQKIKKVGLNNILNFGSSIQTIPTTKNWFYSTKQTGGSLIAEAVFRTNEAWAEEIYLTLRSPNPKTSYIALTYQDHVYRAYGRTEDNKSILVLLRQLVTEHRNFNIDNSEEFIPKFLEIVNKYPIDVPPNGELIFKEWQFEEINKDSNSKAGAKNGSIEILKYFVNLYLNLGSGKFTNKELAVFEPDKNRYTKMFKKGLLLKPIEKPIRGYWIIPDYKEITDIVVNLGISKEYFDNLIE